jgi:hypothetical protein
LDVNKPSRERGQLNTSAIIDEALLDVVRQADVQNQSVSSCESQEEEDGNRLSSRGILFSEPDIEEGERESSVSLTVVICFIFIYAINHRNHHKPCQILSV